MKISLLIFISAFNFHNVASAQWWNPLEPKDFDECVIKNLKSGMGEEAVNALRFSCMQKYPPKTSAAEQLASKKIDEKYKKCRIEKDYKTHQFLTLGVRNSYKTSDVISKLKTFKYESAFDRVSFQNMNSFGISGVMVGFTTDKQCHQKIEDYRFSTYCNTGFTERGVASSAYGSLNCGQLPKEAKAMGFCPIGYSPLYNQFNDSFLDFLESNNYCN